MVLKRKKPFISKIQTVILLIMLAISITESIFLLYIINNPKKYTVPGKYYNHDCTSHIDGEYCCEPYPTKIKISNATTNKTYDVFQCYKWQIKGISDKKI